MKDDKKSLLEFLTDVKSENYSEEFVSFHASNLIAQEGIINYDINLADSNTLMVLSFFIKLDVEPVDKITFNGIINDLIEVFNSRDEPEEIQILFTLHKNEIKQLYNKYEKNRISIESLRSALRRYCDKKDDFDKLINLAGIP